MTGLGKDGDGTKKNMASGILNRLAIREQRTITIVKEVCAMADICSARQWFAVRPIRGGLLGMRFRAERNVTERNVR